jgi:hypothetical protein
MPSRVSANASVSPAPATRRALYTRRSCCLTAGITAAACCATTSPKKSPPPPPPRPRAAITLRQAPIANGMLAVSAKFTLDSSTEGGQAQAYLALYENDLATPVAAGENRGKKLRHDFVVRELAGPFNAGSGDSFDIVHNFRLARGWKPGDLHVAAFVQNRLSVDVLQALAAPRCN